TSTYIQTYKHTHILSILQDTNRERKEEMTTTSGDSQSTSDNNMLKYKEQKLVSKQIEKQLKNEKKLLDREMKLLLLGTGDSGKSTIVKQMKIIHMKGYTPEERTNHKSLIYRNVIEIFRSLIEGCDIINVRIDPSHEQLCDQILDLHDSRKYSSMDIGLIRSIVGLSKDASIQQALMTGGAKFQIHSSANYFISSLERIADVNYLPTDQDILCTRVMTTAVSETRFNVRGINFRMIDVGGQRGHREKWIHHFSDVTAILFIVSLSEYDQVLEEDTNTNRMIESVKVFSEIINGKWFTEIPMLLFLNKSDLFAEKIKRTNLNVCFKEYQGASNYDDALLYIKKKLLSCNNNKSKQIYTHITTATDTGNITVVFNAVKDILTRQTMEEGGI
ncbi:hypothetical protein SAMD00019534_073910, partial [Acytostelium subglobosum LB1]|uniref:hypothetical protein n=1 Tax=Acytostelium subglobosum LB1 TaxID=1410327 RepID=UPI000644F952